MLRDVAGAPPSKERILETVILPKRASILLNHSTGTRGRYENNAGRFFIIMVFMAECC